MSDNDKLPGEGEVKIIRRECVRRECDFCGEVADKRHTYLLPDARRNPASSAYGRDDCTHCCDHEVYTCAACRKNDREPDVEGYGWCGTFYNPKLTPSMFLRWQETDITPKAEAAE